MGEIFYFYWEEGFPIGQKLSSTSGKQAYLQFILATNSVGQPMREALVRFRERNKWATKM